MAKNISGEWKTWLPPDQRELGKVTNALWISENCETCRGKAKTPIDYKLCFDNESLLGLAFKNDFARAEEIEWYVKALKNAGATEARAEMEIGCGAPVFKILYKGNIDTEKLKKQLYM